jgi:hypothetical protein
VWSADDPARDGTTALRSSVVSPDNHHDDDPSTTSQKEAATGFARR